MELSKDLYEYRSVKESIVSESDRQGDTVIGWTITKIDYGDGIRTYIQGADYHQKGFAPPEAVWANNIVKRIIVKGIELVNPLRFSKIIDNFTDIAWKVMRPYLLKRQYLTEFSREIHDLTLNFLNEYGLKAATAFHFSQIIAHLFEYDNAYRLRLEDLFTETTKEQLLANPGKEINRLLAINSEREIIYPEVGQKFKTFGLIISTLLKLPKVKKAFIRAIEQSDFTNLQLDNVDKYWACHRTDYNFMGLTYEQRGIMLENAGLKRVEGKRVNI